MGLKEEAGHFKDPLIFFIVLQFYQSFTKLCYYLMREKNWI